ncbi:hypothetical protein [Xanthocytophaga agilis]|uniref:Uncharacterized protein n=1 Tax=Xanthocytophaga agilis TaxID=3048010 RepID=A0AAE3UF13_9BACT|nr:hypothetical protein [Xanthocytophaga agilis]MDJ1500882.1 hypothetical protein [Xanthocytophaga agilis]
MDNSKEIAAKYHVSEETVKVLLYGLRLSGGTQVQFNIPELGGMGQWQSGMVMIGDMFNSSLKDKVNQICTELAVWIRNSDAHAETQILPDHHRATADKSTTKATPTRSASFQGSQNGLHYAYYASENVLEIDDNGKKAKYDTTGYQLTGVQQSQDNSSQSVSFTHPGGTLRLKDLKKIKDVKKS